MIGKYTKSFGISFALVSLLSALLTLVKESNKALLSYMASFGHHWLTHGIFVVGLFVLLGLVFPFLLKEKTQEKASCHMALMVAIPTLLSGALIAGFYLLELFK